MSARGIPRGARRKSGPPLASSSPSSSSSLLTQAPPAMSTTPRKAVPKKKGPPTLSTTATAPVNPAPTQHSPMSDIAADTAFAIGRGAHRPPTPDTGLAAPAEADTNAAGMCGPDDMAGIAGEETDEEASGDESAMANAQVRSRPSSRPESYGDPFRTFLFYGLGFGFVPVAHFSALYTGTYRHFCLWYYAPAHFSALCTTHSRRVQCANGRAVLVMLIGARNSVLLSIRVVRPTFRSRPASRPGSPVHSPLFSPEDMHAAVAAAAASAALAAAPVIEVQNADPNGTTITAAAGTSAESRMWAHGRLEPSSGDRPRKRLSPLRPQPAGDGDGDGDGDGLVMGLDADGDGAANSQDSSPSTTIVAAAAATATRSLAEAEAEAMSAAAMKAFWTWA